MPNYYRSQLLYKVKAHLKKGGIIAYPTESCFGLGCDPFNYRAINSLLKLKQRDKNKGLIVIAGQIKHLHKLIAELSLDEQHLLKQYWPGPFSLLLPTQKSVPKNLVGKHQKLATRVTKHQLVQQLCNFLNQALVSTSANKSGHLAVKTYRTALAQFGHKALVLPGITNFNKNPSTIIDWASKRILRN